MLVFSINKYQFLNRGELSLQKFQFKFWVYNLVTDAEKDQYFTETMKETKLRH